MQYIKCTVAESDYKETRKINGKWFVHFGKTEDTENKTVSYIECVTDTEPDMEQIEADYAVYKAAMDAKAQLRANEEEVKELKQNLADTDYMAIKFAEGWITADDYAPVKAQRQAWRDRINELQNDASESE